jgi:hypothetical protein
MKDVWRQFVKDVPALYTFRPALKMLKKSAFSR